MPQLLQRENTQLYLKQLNQLGVSLFPTNQMNFPQFASTFFTFCDSKNLTIDFNNDKTIPQMVQLIYNGDLLQSHILAFPHLENLTIKAEQALGIGNIGIKFVSAIFSTFIYLRSLSVNLSFSNIEFDEIEVLSDALVNLIHLETLQIILNRNKIGHFGIECLCQVIPKTLIQLDLQLEDTQIEFLGVEKLSNCITNLTKLQSVSLNLSHNYFGDSEVQKISECLASLSDSLTSLSLELGDNKISGEGARVLSQTIRKLENLSKIDISLHNNNLNNRNAIEVTSAISSLPKLDTLVLNLINNKIVIEMHNEMFLIIGQMTGLKSLYLMLSKENLKGDKQQQLFSFASKLNNLIDLRISNYIKDYTYKDLLLEIKNNDNLLRQLFCFQIDSVKFKKIRKKIIRLYPRLVHLKIS